MIIAYIYGMLKILKGLVQYHICSFFYLIRNVFNQVGKSNSFLFHSACIWGVEMYPALEHDLQIPKNSFITCSSDDTIRVWNLDRIECDRKSLYQKNIYSNVSMNNKFNSNNITKIHNFPLFRNFLK